MRTKSLGVFLSLVGFVAMAGPEPARADGFQLPNLNPFKSRPTRKADKSEAGAAGTETGLKFPTLPSPPSLRKPNLPSVSVPKLPSFKSAERKSTGSSTWAGVQKKTRAIFGKTKSVLMPWKRSPQKAVTTSSGGMRIARQPAKKSIFPSFLGPKRDEPKIESVNDYLALPRPVP